MYLIFRIEAAPKRKEKLRQTSVQSYYKTLQMVYCLDTKRQLGKPTNDMINAVCKHHLRAVTVRKARQGDDGGTGNVARIAMVNKRTRDAAIRD